jgi:hypothetical protein
VGRGPAEANVSITALKDALSEVDLPADKDGFVRAAEAHA